MSLFKGYDQWKTTEPEPDEAAQCLACEKWFNVADSVTEESRPVCTDCWHKLHFCQHDSGCRHWTLCPDADGWKRALGGGWLCQGHEE